MTRITVGGVTRVTSHVPETHTAPITRIEFDDGKHVLDEGQLILTANPPADDTAETGCRNHFRRGFR